MIIGVLIGVYVEDVGQMLSRAGSLKGVQTPLVLGLIIMMWPILTKVQYERLPGVFKTRNIWSQLLLSLLLNWIVGPFLMLALSWCTLPDLPTYRTGIIMVGIARCIAMVMIWCDLSKGDTTMCALLVIFNSILQIILYAPYSVWFVRIISRVDDFALRYDETAIAVLIYLGIPLFAGCATRLIILFSFGSEFLQEKFLPCFGPLSLVALLYTIIIIFASQARRILDNLGPTFRTFVPLILYFTIMWTSTFFLIFGADSDQALAATIGPLVEVPVLLALSWISLYLGQKLHWGGERANVMRTAARVNGACKLVKIKNSAKGSA
ncbi:ARSENICAL-RESISTANCE PROTEIN 3 [Ceraceosorus bombacis]|uniref:ARSENICAL-RESISTANCE PROTEIN 3 n=1 Tax=Ceraceosorus bombacis TaxID=401625 RepID=A0A0P1BBM4_9BASI|nr:ARSENICAL-RESISTANCE PROTEIN 3 [Ceraceosorus bombacis]